MSKELIYFGDPMCSWCWGFAPTIGKIYKEYSNKAPLVITTGGLHAYDKDPMNDQYKATIRHHWEDVNRATGADFNYSFFDRVNFVLDTEPACRAVVSVRSMDKTKALNYYESISRSFYVENQDTTDTDTLCRLAKEIDLDIKEFTKVFESDLLKHTTLEDFRYSQKMGITGFPTLVGKEQCGDDQKLALISTGYQSYEQIKPVIDHWLEYGLEEQEK